MRNASPSPSSWRMRLATSYPSIAGMVMSSSTTSGRRSLARPKACGPSCAVATSCPQSLSSSPRAWAASISSSTIRIRRRGPPASIDVTDSKYCETRATRESLATAPPLQMAPARRDEDRGVCVEGIPVGHTGDVVRDRSLRAIALRDSLMLGRQKLGMFLEMLEELPQDALGFAVLGFSRPGEIDILEHELAECVRRIQDVVAHRDFRLAVRSDDYVVDHRVEAFRTIATERGPNILRDVLFPDDLRAHRVVDVVVEIRDLVGVADDPTFGRLGDSPGGGLDPALRRRAVLLDAVANFRRQVQTGAVLLDLLEDAHALLVVAEAVGQELPEQLLADVPERRVPDVVAHGHRLDEILVETQAASHRPANLRDLERVRQARAVVVADRRKEDLGLVLQPAERLAVDDAIAVERERGPGRRWIFGTIAMRICRAGRVFGELGLLELLGVLADPQRRDRARSRKLGFAACLCGHFA